MVDARTALEQFKREGDVEELTGFTPTAVVELKSKEGNFVSGTFLQRRELKGSKAGVSAIALRLAATNARASKKIGNEYPEVKVKEGDRVTVFAFTQLDRKLKEVKEGTEVFIEYLGKKTEVRNGRKVTSHQVNVRAKVGVPIEQVNRERDEVPL